MSWRDVVAASSLKALKRLRGAWKRMRPPTASALLGSALRILCFFVLQQCECLLLSVTFRLIAAQR